MTDAPAGWKAWGIVVLCTIGYFVLGAIPAPGIDHEALEAAMQVPGGVLVVFNTASLFPTVSLLGSGIGALVIVRGALAVLPVESRVWSVLGFVAYEVIAVFGGLTTAVWLESIGGMGLGGDPVMEPGWGFRLMLALTFAAGAAVIWALALAITRTQRAHGTLWLSGVALLVAGIGKLAAVGPMLQIGGPLVAGLGPVLFGTVPAVIVLVALWRFHPTAWPVPVLRKATLLSPVDAVVLPYVVSGLASAPFVLATSLLPISEGSSTITETAMCIEPLLSVAVAVVVAIWLARRAPETRQTGSILYPLAVPLLLFAAASIVVVSLVSSGWLERALDPGPFAGDLDAEVTLVTDDPAARGASDGAIVVERLAGLGLAAEVTSADDRRIVVVVHDVSDPRAALDAVVPRRLLEFRLVAEDQGALDPSRASLPLPPAITIDRNYDGSAMYVASTPEQLGPVLDPLEPRERTRVAIECRVDEDPDGTADRQACSPFLLDEVILDGTNVANAEVQMDPMDGRPHVALEFDAAGAQRFGDVTAASIHRKLAIVLDGRIQSAPVIQSEIRGGRAQITLGSAMRYEALMQEANELVVALRSGALSTSWRVERMNTI